MDDCISRSAAIKAARRHEVELPLYSPKETDIFWNDAIGIICDELEVLPSAEPERKHGRWIHIRTEPDGNALYECSECHKGEVHVPIVEVHYCWNCGARMDGEGE